MPRTKCCRSTAATSPLRHNIHRLLGVALVVAAASPSIGYAEAQPAADPTIAHACGVTMKLDPGTVDYDDCVQSIQSAQAEEHQSKATQQSWATCASEGLKEGTPDFAMCVLDPGTSLQDGEWGDMK